MSQSFFAVPGIWRAFFCLNVFAFVYSHLSLSPQESPWLTFSHFPRMSSSDEIVVTPQTTLSVILNATLSISLPYILFLLPISLSKYHLFFSLVPISPIRKYCL
jgi:ABC-type polysaccharide transport system permease subunit